MRKIAEIIILILVSTVLLGCIDQKGSLGGKTIDIEGTPIDKTGNDWCKTDTNLTSVGPAGNLVTFKIKGITSHNGIQLLCEADYDNNGTMIQYFNKNKSYNIMVIKSGNGTQEIDVRRVKQ